MPAKTDTCKGCGAKIVWATTADNKRICLDPRAPVYRYSEEGDGTPRATRAETMAGYPGYFYAVSHFATCPKAAEFSGRNKARDNAPRESAQ